MRRHRRTKLTIAREAVRTLATDLVKTVRLTTNTCLTCPQQ